MYLITLQLTGPDREVPDHASLTEFFASLTAPTDQVEHLRVLCGPGRIDLALFLLAPNAPTAEVMARVLALRATRTAHLSRWRLTGSALGDPDLSGLH
ncbi:hypothetical protein C7C46_18760 [Streptomyces tateyamensis]|uniref:Uncharacterized protein n=1 Tax=Streptomyces tateyamensis TaxID=565073 RepID=A0A2V4N119_9ACTN|nr:hypothetical protein [Streptomyces tateyamensis]PYC77444.1 hypothetical protein C7C46_18760 [Streptomyces tateyamensis]